jgi:DNA polymerase-3 subunit beta
VKLSVHQSELSKALSLVRDAVATRSTLPVLGNVLLEAQADTLRISATNLEIGVQLFVAAKVEESGAITLPYRLLSEFVSSLQPQAVSIDLDERTQTAKLKCVKTTASIKGIDAAEFPVPQRIDSNKAIALPSQVLRRMIDGVVGAAATDESRPTLTGVETRLSDGRLHMAATDGYRLSVMTQDVEADDEITTIIPAASLRMIAKFLTGESDVMIALDENRVHVTAQDGNAEIVSSIIGAKFPDYRAIIPKTKEITVTVKRDTLQQATKTAQLFARDNSNIVRIDVTPVTLTVAATSAESGDSVNAIDATANGEISISFNARYLLDMLSATSADELTIEFTQSNRPLKCTVGDWMHVVMPMHAPR